MSWIVEFVAERNRSTVSFVDETKGDGKESEREGLEGKEDEPSVETFGTLEAWGIDENLLTVEEEGLEG